jgi:Ca2+:H+ antiporter
VIFRFLLLLIPLSLALAYGVHAAAVWVFITAVAAIVPLSEYIRQATDEIAHVCGEGIGGLLNVTFGNAPELIIAVFLLHAGAVEVVKAQIIGAIIGNSLLGLGLAIVAGSLGRQKQVFKKESASMLSSMLILCVIALLLPALFDLAIRRTLSPLEVQARDLQFSFAVAGVLMILYAGNLVYTLVTHDKVYATLDAAVAAPAARANWPLLVSLAVLLAAAALTALEAELISGALQDTADRLHLSTFFLGVIVLAVVGNIPEKAAAIYFARRDRMELVVTITVGSTIQMALLIAPAMVFISHLMHRPMDLVFSSPLELAAVVSAVFVVNSIAQDGETTWFEGVLLLGVYLLLALAFFFVG